MTTLLEALLDNLPDLEGKGTCRNYMEVFDHAAEGHPGAIDQAKAICARCPVLARCQADLTAVGGWGVVAGLTADERDRQIRSGRQYIRPLPAVTVARTGPASKRCPACERIVLWTKGRRAAGPWWCSDRCRRVGRRIVEAEDDAA